jgi:hypothetical protein
MRRLRTRFPHTLVAQWVPQTRDDLACGARRPVTGHRADGLLVIDFVTDARGSAPSPRERTMLHDALAADRLVERVR